MDTSINNDQFSILKFCPDSDNSYNIKVCPISIFKISTIWMMALILVPESNFWKCCGQSCHAVVDIPTLLGCPIFWYRCILLRADTLTTNKPTFNLFFPLANLKAAFYLTQPSFVPVNLSRDTTNWMKLGNIEWSALLLLLHKTIGINLCHVKM